MPQVNQVQNLLLANAPPNVRAQAQAGEDAVQRAAAPSAPYTSRMAGLAKALEGGLGGLMEGSAIKQVMDGQQAGRQQMLALADALHGAQGQGGAAQGNGMSAPMPSAMPMGQGGIGSDHVATRNPAGYDPKATEALIRARAPAYGITPDAAVAIARSEGLGHYVGDSGSSYGPFQLHYGNVAGGGNAVGGLGDAFTKQTGLDARDPATVPQQVDFALQNAAQGGWAPWHGRKTAGMGVWDGIGRGGGTAQASADTPAANAHPVASDTLPPGITPDMVSAPPASDGTVRGDLLAAAAQHGGLDPDTPAPGATPTGMAGLPPGVTPAMFAAMQNTATDGNALHRGDEMPAGTPPYVPGQVPAPAPPPISPATSNATAAAALATLKPDLGVTQAAVVPDPVPASAPDAPVPPSILPPPRPPSGDVAGPASVPAPQGDLTPPAAPASDGSVRGDLIAAAQQHGMDVAMDPVVPDPQGSLVPPAPSSTNGALQGPQSDAASGGAASGAGIAPQSPPSPLPDTAPMPPPGAQSLQAPADVASAAAAATGPELDPEGTGPQNYSSDGGPTLRDQIAAAFNGGGAPAPAPASGLPLEAGLGAPTDAPAGAPPSSPPAAGPSSASAPLPMMAQAGVPGPTPLPPQPGTGAALPATGPMPPPGGQTPGAGSSLPQVGPMPPPGGQSLALADALDGAKPAPGAVPAGPAPLQGDASTPPAPSAPQPMAMGLPGQGGGDPSSAQAVMRQDAMRAQGGAPQPGGLMGSIQGMFSPGSPQNVGTGLMRGAPPAGSLPVQGSGQGGTAASAQAPAPAPGVPAGAAQAPQPGAPATGNYGQARQVAAQILSNPYAQPAAVEMAGKILFPQAQVVTGADGKTYAVNPQEGTARLLFDGGAKFDPNQSLMQGGHFTQAPDKPMDVAPGHVVTTFGANNQAIPQVQAPNTPNFGKVDGTGLVMDPTTGQFRPIPGGVNGTATVEAGGAKVPISTNTGPNGVTATPLVGGAGGAAPGQGGPLDAVAPLVKQSQAMDAQGAAQKEGATAEVKGAQAYVDKAATNATAASQHVAELEQLKGLASQTPQGWQASAARFGADHGWVTADGNKVQSYDGFRAYLGTQLRQAGSGALRNAEMDKLSDALGNTSTDAPTRLAAITRMQVGFQRQAALGQYASDPSLTTPQARQSAMVGAQQSWANADAAVAQGADPAKVRARLQQAGVPAIGF